MPISDRRQVSHLILPFKGQSLADATGRLLLAHDHLTTCADLAISSVPLPEALDWGLKVKRTQVELAGAGCPTDIGKPREALSEIVNMVATLERLLGALRWFAREPQFQEAQVWECHPSTSNAPGSNDLVLADPNGTLVALVEVCDVISGRRDGNRKEKSSVRKLGCNVDVPPDGARRFIVTSPEFAERICRPNRMWQKMHYKYDRHAVGDADCTAILEVLSADLF